jgi:hypothetical protein
MTGNISRMSPVQQRSKRFYGGKRGLSVQEIYSHTLRFPKTPVRKHCTKYQLNVRSSAVMTKGLNI